jgi:hypothetical protein
VAHGGVGLVAVLLTPCSEGSAAPSSVRASEPGSRTHSRGVMPLVLVNAPTPRFRVSGFDTSGTYPRVSGKNSNLRAVNATLRNAVLADQRAWEPIARSARADLVHRATGRWRARGVYRTEVVRRFSSASTVVVSALIGVTRAPTHYLLRGAEPLTVTVRVPSGRRVAITDLFEDRSKGLRELAAIARAQLRRGGFGQCLDRNPSLYSPSARNYRNFVLTPRGLHVQFERAGYCGPVGATVAYDRLRELLSSLGGKLVAGVRKPR